jgi:transposase
MVKSSIKQNKDRKGYKFRLIVTNSNIKRQLNKIVGCCRSVWNKALALVKQDDENYRTMLKIAKMNGGDGECISSLFKFNPYNQLSALLTTWKQQAETAFLKQIYSKSLQIMLEEFDQTVVAETKNKRNSKGYPVFNADLNASLNIKVAGLAVLACGADRMPSIQNATKKQEPTELR